MWFCGAVWFQNAKFSSENWDTYVVKIKLWYKLGNFVYFVPIISFIPFSCFVSSFCSTCWEFLKSNYCYFSSTYYSILRDHILQYKERAWLSWYNPPMEWRLWASFPPFYNLNLKLNNCIIYFGNYNGCEFYLLRM